MAISDAKTENNQIPLNYILTHTRARALGRIDNALFNTIDNNKPLSWVNGPFPDNFLFYALLPVYLSTLNDMVEHHFYMPVRVCVCVSGHARVWEDKSHRIGGGHRPRRWLGCGCDHQIRYIISCWFEFVKLFVSITRDGLAIRVDRESGKWPFQCWCHVRGTEMEREEKMH